MRVPRFVSRLGSTTAILVALAGASFAQQADPARSLAAQNAELVAQIADATSALDSSLADLAQVRKGKDDLEENMHRIEHSAQVHALDGEFARTVIEELRVLPKPGRFARERAARAAHAGGDKRCGPARRASAARARRPRRCSREALWRRRSRPCRKAQRPQVEATVRALLVEQVALLTRLGELRQKLMQTLRETIDAERDLEQAERRSARGAEPPAVLDTRPARDADGPRTRAVACLDDVAHELARGRRGPAGRSSAQAVLARRGLAGGCRPLRRAQAVAARARVACAHRRHLRALSHRPCAARRLRSRSPSRSPARS